MEEPTAASPGSGGDSPQQEDTDESGLRGSRDFVTTCETDMFLPIAGIGGIMRRALPANAKIMNEAKQCVQECATEFIGFVTSEASDKCLKDKRKSITGDDVISAMITLGYENYAEVLKAYLSRYREGDNRSASGSGGAPDSHKDTDEVLASLPNVLL